MNDSIIYVLGFALMFGAPLVWDIEVTAQNAVGILMLIFGVFLVAAATEHRLMRQQ